MVKRMKRSVKIILSLSILIVVAAISLVATDQVHYIDGHVVFDTIDPFEDVPDGLDLDSPEVDEDLTVLLINFTGEWRGSVGEDGFTVFQKYQVGENEYCVRDCAYSCPQMGLEYHSAFSQQWGVCRCKCQP